MLPHRQAGKSASVLLGTAVVAFALSQIHAPAGLAEGGSFGITLLMFHRFGLSPAVSGCLLDGILLLLAARSFGKAFTRRSLGAVLGYSLFYALFERLPSPLYGLAQYPLAAAAVGGLLLGAGTGLVVRGRAACGGDDALALLLSHRLRRPVSLVYLLMDGTVLALCAALLPPETLAASLVSCLVSSLTVGLVQAPAGGLAPRPAG